MGRVGNRMRLAWPKSFSLLFFSGRAHSLTLAVIFVGLFGQPSWAQDAPGLPVGGPQSQRPLCPVLENSPPDPQGYPASPTDGMGGSDYISLSGPMFQSILPDIPNLRGGYILQFGGGAREGRLTLDYTLPKSVNGKDVAFAQTYARFEDLLKILGGSPCPQIQLLLGGGYRKRLPNDVMLGANIFLNANRLHTRWYTSGILGFEMAAVIAGTGVTSLNFNYYGNIFYQTSGFFSVFRHKPGDYRIQFTYSQPFLDRSFDLQLKASCYKFHRQAVVYGWNLGMELITSNRAVSIKYEIGYDRMNERYNVVGVAFNVGFQVNKLMAGENPFVRY